MTLSRLLDTTLARIRPVSQPSGTFTTRLPMGRSPFPLLVITTTATGLLCWWDSHPLEWQLASLHPSFNSNGNTADREGRLVTCEHLARRVSRTEHDGSITVLADRYEGRRLNSPNDVVVKSDGSIWFSDPTYGID